MISFLSRLFIKDRTNYNDSTVRKKYGTLTGLTGIFLNICLFAGKFIAGIVTGAISITADAFNNLSDAGSSFVTLMGFRLAYKEPDSGHPYGHGRMEYISGFIVSIMIILMGFELGKSSFERIINPKDIETGILSIVVLTVSIVVKIYMNFYNRHYGKLLNSASMKATATDSLSDSVATSVVLISVIIARITGVSVDGYVGMAVSLFILFAGIKSVKDTIDPLLGQPPEQDFVNKIYKIANSYDQIVGIHDLVVHDYGPARRMISFHGEVPEDGNINELHEVIDRCERQIRKELGCETIIHMDPIAVNDEKVNKLKSILVKKIKDYNPDITIHDFRVVDGPNRQNVIFDAVVPIECKDKSADVEKKLGELVRELPGNCYGVIDIDRQFINFDGVNQ